MSGPLKSPFVALVILLLVARGNAQTTGTKAPGTGAKTFADYEIILQRNIFDPSRTPSRRSGNSTQGSGPAADQVHLLGTWLTNRQTVAFIEGTRPEHSGAPTVGASLGEWRLAVITTDHVVLEKGDKKLLWPVGQRIERSGNGDWGLAGSATPLAVPAESAAPSAGGEGNAKDMLQLMRERRQKEMMKQ